MQKTMLKLESSGATVETAHIEKALEAVPGVASVNVDTTLGEAVVEHDGADEKTLVAALRAAGYGRRE